MPVKEEKKILDEIKKLAANKPMIRQYDEARESLEGVREHHMTLYAQLKAKAAELEVVKEVCATQGLAWPGVVGRCRGRVVRAS